MNENRQTPYYVIHKNLFEKNCLDIEESFHREWGENIQFGYSIKTNNCREIVALAKQRGWLAEVVSLDEYTFAEKMGYSQSEIICNGPVKGDMISRAIQNRQIVNLDNLYEVNSLIDAVNDLHVDTSEVSVGLRMNANFDRLFPNEATTEDGISRFGLSDENNEFGIAVANLRSNGIPISGVHLHSSTKTRSAGIFNYLADMACKIDEKYSLGMTYIDIGGGFWGGQAVEGKPTMLEYASTICNALKKRFSPSEVTLILEPGASVAATAMDYVTTVINIKDVRERRIITLDGTALHINPFMVNRKPSYEVRFMGNNRIVEQHLCGCTCMEKDKFDIVFNEKEFLPGTEIVFHNVGAYTNSFNSHFILAPPAIYIDK